MTSLTATLFPHHRFDHTAIGNSVNLLARRIWAAVEKDVGADSAGTMQVKGLSQPVEVYLLKGLAPGPAQTER